MVAKLGLSDLIVEDYLLGVSQIVTEESIRALVLGPKGEDKLRASARSTDAELANLREKIAVIPDDIEDWCVKGWRRSLEYFIWSEFVGPSNGSRAFETKSCEATAEQPPLQGHWNSAPLDEVLIGRRTKRKFTGAPVPRHVIDELLAADTGWQLGAGFHMYIVSYDVAETDLGAFKYDPEVGLQPLAAMEYEYREAMRGILCGMPAPRSAAATLVLTADLASWMRKRPYERALRELYVESGRVSQRLTVVAEALGLASMVTPATHDDELAALLSLDHTIEIPVTTLTVGRRRGSRTMPD
jgi:SagB-type dehydrogenase family enzyme